MVTKLQKVLFDTAATTLALISSLGLKTNPLEFYNPIKSKGIDQGYKGRFELSDKKKVNGPVY